MVSNLSAWDNLTSPDQVLSASNTTSEGYLFALFLLALFVILLIALKHFDTKVVFPGVSFIIMILGVFIWAAGYITFVILIWPILIFFASIVALIFWPT